MTIHCGECFYGQPVYLSNSGEHDYVLCVLANRKVFKAMTACMLHKEREDKMNNNKKPTKRNIYKTTDAQSLKGYWVCELIDNPFTMVAKRPYRWGKKSGVAVRAHTTKGVDFIIEVTQSLLVRQLNSKKYSTLNVEYCIREKVSKKGHKYYVIERV